MEQRRKIDFRFLAEPTDVNFGGKVHSGIVMKWMDQSGLLVPPNGVRVTV